MLSSVKLILSWSDLDLDLGPDLDPDPDLGHFILVFFNFGRLPFWSSSILVVFHFGHLPFWSSSILVVFLFGCLSFIFLQKSSSWVEIRWHAKNELSRYLGYRFILVRVICYLFVIRYLFVCYPLRGENKVNQPKLG